MSLRSRILEAIKKGQIDEVETMISTEPRGVRYLLGLVYRPEEEIREGAAKSIARASRHHPKLVKNIIERLVWAMKSDSGANAQGAPVVLLAIAEEKPDLLLPIVPDLIHLGADTSLYQGLCDTLRAVVKRCPGKVGEKLSRELSGKSK